MRIIKTVNFVKDRPACEIDAILNGIKQHAEIDTLGGLLVLNARWHSDDEDEVNFGIEAKMLARDRGMYFFQAATELKEPELLNAIKSQITRFGWEGNYLWMPHGWKFTGPIELAEVERILDGSKRAVMPALIDDTVQVLATGGYDTPFFGRLQEFGDAVEPRDQVPLLLGDGVHVIERI